MEGTLLGIAFGFTDGTVDRRNGGKNEGENGGSLLGSGSTDSIRFVAYRNCICQCTLK